MKQYKHNKKLNNLTQAKLAKLLKVQSTAVSAWELDRNHLMDKVELMSELFRISKSDSQRKQFK